MALTRQASVRIPFALESAVRNAMGDMSPGLGDGELSAFVRAGLVLLAEERHRDRVFGAFSRGWACMNWPEGEAGSTP
jgi:hypothetical protein